MSDESNPRQPEAAPRIKFSYLKSPGFRVIHVDGGIGSVTPTGYIHLALYSERLPIPRELVHEVKPDGTLGAEVRDERVAKAGVLRELEVDAIFSLQTAVGLRDWLTEKITELETAMDTATSGEGSESEGAQ